MESEHVMADIGEPLRRIDFEPVEAPADVPVEAPVEVPSRELEPVS